MNRQKGYLALATGKVYSGWLFGAIPGENSSGEVVFNTSITGYQEILTDPSYQGQIVVMTPSHIGNYGVNSEDVESQKIYLSGFVVQELSATTSNWRSNDDLSNYLKKAGVTGLTGVDTRALTRHLRELGTVNGLISSAEISPDELVKRAKQLPSMEGQDLVKFVTAPESYIWNEPSHELDKPTTSSEAKQKRKVVVIDFGVKQNILRCLVDRGCDVTVVPATTPASQILDLKPDGVMLSNGPGDPASVTYGIESVRQLVEYNQKRADKGEKPFAIFGICLGHQILSLAMGGKTFKLKFGHHGANHPIKDLETGKVDITTQNHGFAVAADQKENSYQIPNQPDVKVTHVNLNDHSVAGIRHAKLPLASVQYHPEASAGPHDARHLFDRFIKMMETPDYAETN